MERLSRSPTAFLKQYFVTMTEIDLARTPIKTLARGQVWTKFNHSNYRMHGNSPSLKERPEVYYLLHLFLHFRDLFLELDLKLAL